MLRLLLSTFSYSIYERPDFKEDCLTFYSENKSKGSQRYLVLKDSEKLEEFTESIFFEINRRIDGKSGCKIVPDELGKILQELVVYKFVYDREKPELRRFVEYIGEVL